MTRESGRLVEGARRRGGQEGRWRGPRRRSEGPSGSGRRRVARSRRDGARNASSAGKEEERDKAKSGEDERRTEHRVGLGVVLGAVEPDQGAKVVLVCGRRGTGVKQESARCFSKSRTKREGARKRVRERRTDFLLEGHHELPPPPLAVGALHLVLVEHLELVGKVVFGEVLKERLDDLLVPPAGEGVRATAIARMGVGGPARGGVDRGVEETESRSATN